MKVSRFTSKYFAIPFWESGGFGNKLRSWQSLEAFERGGCSCSVAIRYKSIRGKGPCEYYVPARDVSDLILKWISDGLDPKRIFISEMAPDDRLLINGELTDDWYFFHSRLRLPMRRALHEGGEHARGLRARRLLRSLMTPSSWEDLNALIELYPDHVIELSVYEVLLGNLKGRNSIVWEVRKY